MSRVFEFMKPIAIKFVRLKTPHGIARAFAESTLRDAGVPRNEWRDCEESPPRSEMVKSIRAEGFWGFCDTKRNVVRYWAAPNLPRWKLLYLLGHEVGHASGKPVRGMIAEENRANTYGAAVESVFRHLSGKRQRR